MFLFQTKTTVIAQNLTSIILTSSTVAANVFWQVGTELAIGSSSSFVGTILAGTGVKIGNKSTLFGRVLAQTSIICNNFVTITNFVSGSTYKPTYEPTLFPTDEPTFGPTFVPSFRPSSRPTSTPSGSPSRYPTDVIIVASKHIEKPRIKNGNIVAIVIMSVFGLFLFIAAFRRSHRKHSNDSVGVLNNAAAAVGVTDVVVGTTEAV